MTITPLSTIKTNEEVDRNKAIYEFYTAFEGRKQDAIEVLKDRYDLTERRIRAIIAQFKHKYVEVK